MVDFKPILPEKFSASDIENVCRICLFPNPILYSVFENEIDILLSAFTPTKVDQNDGFPHQICLKCYEDVKTAFYFKKQCEYAHNLVKSVLKTPLSKKTIICNLCTTNFCSNSNLKRHLRNLHGIYWEIGMPRPDLPVGFQNSVGSIGFSEESNFELECESCGEKFENEKFYSEHICANDDQDDMLFVDPADEVNVKRKFRKLNTNTPINTELNENYGESSSNALKFNTSVKDHFNNSNSDSPTTEFTSKENEVVYPIPPTKAPTIKDLIVSSSKIEENKIEILNYFDLMPEEKRLEYESLVEEKKAERKKAYKILKKVSTNIAKSLLLKKKQILELKDGKFECFECKKCFDKIIFLRRHQLNHLSEPKPYSCGICSKLFSHTDYLKCHIRSIHPNTNAERLFKCIICRKLLSRAVDLTRHVKICGVQNQLLLKTTHGEEKRENEQRKHFNVSDKDISKFNDQSNTYSSEFSFNQHDYESSTNFDPDGFNDESSFDPAHCDDSNINEQTNYVQDNFESNSNANHPLDMPSPQEVLLSLLSGYPGVNSELMAKKMEAMQRNDNGKFECELCQKEFNRKAHLQRHYLTHTTAKPFSCKFCNSKFSCPEYVQTHINRVHAEKIAAIANNPRIKSELPDYEFFNSNKPNKMRNFHGYQDNNNPMNSRVLVKHTMAIKRRNVSKYDMLKTPEGKFKCGFCDKLYNRAEHVRRHELTHSDSPRPFKCKYCYKEFSRPDNLKKHCDTCMIRKRYEGSTQISESTLTINKSNRNKYRYF